MLHVIQDVKSEYSEVRNNWKTKDYIQVFDENKMWELEIRKRRNSNRTTIHGGWVEMREDLQLQEGDICKFEACDAECINFKVVVERKRMGA